MQRRIEFTPTADAQLAALRNDPSPAALCKQVEKTLGFLELNPRHPSLHTHEMTTLTRELGVKVFTAYAQNNTPAAYRVFWYYGPDRLVKKVRIPGLTIVAITAHP